MTKEQFNKIGVIIDWYAALPAGFNDLESLLKARRQLAGLSFVLAEYVGGRAQAAKQAVAMRKIGFTKARDVSTGSSNAAKEAEAESKIRGLREAEAEAEGAYLAAKVYLESIRDVLNAMAGDINHLNGEKKLSNKTQV